MRQSIYIDFLAPYGAGKSTLIQPIAERLAAERISVKIVGKNRISIKKIILKGMTPPFHLLPLIYSGVKNRKLIKESGIGRRRVLEKHLLMENDESSILLDESFIHDWLMNHDFDESVFAVLVDLLPKPMAFLYLDISPMEAFKRFINRNKTFAFSEALQCLSEDEKFQRYAICCNNFSKAHEFLLNHSYYGDKIFTVQPDVISINLILQKLLKKAF